MVERLRGLGLRGVTARTFHAHALSQLRFFWPLRHDGAALPQLLDSKAPILGRLARQLPGPLPVHADQGPRRRDRVGEVAPDHGTATTSRRPRRPAASRRSRPTCSCATFEGYERAKVRAGRIDFDDLLLGTVDLLEGDAEAAATIRARKRWFSVDEYQDTSPLQQRLLELWLGESRDLCVVGDEDQTIYSFTGATPEFLTSFAERWPGATVVPLVRNYRSTPQVLELANRLIAAEGRSKRLLATRGDGPVPTISRHPSAEHELAALVTWIQAPARGRRRARGGRGAGPDERPARPDRGGPDAGRRRVPGPRHALLRPRRGAVGGPGAAAAPDRGAGSRAAGRGPDAAGPRRSGYEPDGEVEGDEARERQASLETLLAIVDELAAADPAADGSRVLGGARGARRARARGFGGRREPAHVPPGQGPRVGRGVPAEPRGGDPADPAGEGRRRRDRRGAAAAVRRDHAGAGAPRAVLGGAPRDARP